MNFALSRKAVLDAWPAPLSAERRAYLESVSTGKFNEEKTNAEAHRLAKTLASTDFAVRERQRLDSRTKENVHYGTILVERICAYDAMARMIVSRNTQYRRTFVKQVRDIVRRRYALEFDNEDDTFARTVFEEFFEYAMQHTPEANQLQMFAVHWAALVEIDVRRWLCPAAPSPDAVGDEAVDRSRVDRVAFALYERRLSEMYDDMSAGRTWTVATFLSELNTLYMSWLPADPLDAVLHQLRTHPRSARRVRFDDDEARRAVEEAEECARRALGGGDDE